jgi:Putative adhesin
MSVWSVAEPQKLVFDAPVTALQVRIAGGTVNVVGTDGGSPSLQVSSLSGPPLTVTQKGGTVTVAYDDLPWQNFLKWLDRKSWQRSAVVSLAVPTGTRVEVGVVTASAVVTGIEGATEVQGISGDTTLVGLSGEVRAHTVSGSVEAQGMTGDLRFHSVSGDLTVVEGAGGSVRGDSVSGSMIVDVASAHGGPHERPTEVNVTSVSGEIAVRLPHSADTRVEANTASGTLSNAFDDLHVGNWGRKMTGQLGQGTGRLRVCTVSGAIALLRRPASAQDPHEPGPPGPDPQPAGPIDKKVL